MAIDQVDAKSILLKRRLADMLARKLELKQNYGLRFYKPHEKQDLFHSAGDYKYRLAKCANRFGKSDMGCSEDLAFLIGERPWYPEGDPRRTIGIPDHPVKGLVVAADWDKVDEIFTGDGKKGNLGKIWTKIPRDMISSTKRNHSGTIDQIKIKGLHGDSVLFFDTRKSFASNPMGAESSDWDFIHVDEPIEQAHWKAVSRGMIDRGGKAWFTCTLLEQPWIIDFFFPTIEDSRKAEDFYEEITDDGRKRRWCMTGTMYDNPYLSKEDIEDYSQNLTEDERQCRLYGIPMHLSGLVYKEFRSEAHVLSKPFRNWMNFRSPPKDWTIWVRIDPHPRTPHAVLFAAVGPLGAVVLYDEIFENCTAEALARKILNKTAGRTIYDLKVDPRAWIQDQETGMSICERYEAAGLYGMEKGSKDLDQGIDACKAALMAGHDPENPLSKQQLWISPELRTFLWEINRYAWADKQGVPTNKPVDKDDHQMENWRRLMIDNPYWVDLETSNTPVPELSIT